jgi:hypothetical protein
MNSRFYWVEAMETWPMFDARKGGFAWTPAPVSVPSDREGTEQGGPTTASQSRLRPVGSRMITSETVLKDHREFDPEARPVLLGARDRRRVGSVSGRRPQEKNHRGNSGRVSGVFISGGLGLD